VLVHGRIDYYIKGGQLSINAHQVLPFGKGIMHIKLEELKKALAREGLFDKKYKKVIPKRPNNVAIITSTKGAAFQDFFTTVRQKNHIINITAIDVRVQGECCVSDVVTALKCADLHGFDVIVLSRGGGSFEDLYSFNDEQIVRTIFDMKTPIITAIGHETDYTLSDYVSDLRAITPTAAAEIVAFDVSQLKTEIINLAKGIAKASKQRYENLLNTFTLGAKEIKNKANLLYNNQFSSIKHLTSLFGAQTKHYAQIKIERLNAYFDKLNSLNPLKQLDKGYFKLTSNGQSINNISELNVDSMVNIIGIDGVASAKIISKEINDELREEY